MNSPHEFRRLLDAAQRVTSDGAAALATLVRTAGSTYRRAGTSMLVAADGSVTSPLAGGCPQHDLVQRALRTIASDAPEIARYDRNTGLDVLIETGCEGELDVLVEPLTCARDLRFLDALATLQELRACGFMATVYARDGVVLSPRPQRLIESDGVDWNDIASASLRDRVANVGRALACDQYAIVQRLAVDRTRFDVLFESLQPAHRLVIFGANAGALALARMALSLGWDCVLVDPAPSPTDAMEGIRFVRASADAIRRLIAFDRYTSLVAMTHNLERDLAYLRALAGVPLAYLGVIGSRERVARIQMRLPEVMNLHAPAGLDIGSETPEEIALSVMAEIQGCLHARTADSLATSTAPIHS